MDELFEAELGEAMAWGWWMSFQKRRVSPAAPFAQIETLERRRMCHGADHEHHITLSRFLQLSKAEQALIDPHFVEDDRSEAEQLNPPLVTNGLWPSASSPVALPDLVPVRVKGAYEPYLDETSEPGHALLRFGTAFGNIGAGPAVLGASSQTLNADGTQTVYQRFFSYDKTANKFVFQSDRPIGRFIYHPSHMHLHFEGYARYRLRQVVNGQLGKVAYRSDGTPAVGDKVSFCLANTIQSFVDAKTGRSSKDFPGYSASGQPAVSCGVQQGLHVGKADIYDADFEGQWIDVTGVVPGRYILEVSIDIQGAIAESNDANNTIRIPVTLGTSTVGSQPIIVADRFDQRRRNDSLATATDVGVMGVSTLSGLNLDRGRDEDWFKFVASSSGTGSLQTLAADRDVDLYVYASDGSLLGQSTQAEDGVPWRPAKERVTAGFIAGETYYAKVTGLVGNGRGGLCTNYTLRFELTPKVKVAVVSDVTDESGRRMAVLSVSRNGPVSQPLVVHYTLTGSATPGTDFAPLSGYVKFGVGSARRNIFIIGLADDQVEGPERLTLNFADSSLYLMDRRTRAATLRITDNTVTK